jgi:myosin heavy subunit
MQPNSVKQSQSAQGNYQPSVPISLYKELASELQSAQNKVTSLQVQNEQLLKQNQTLIREFTKEFEAIANSSQQLLQLLKTLSPEIQAQAQAVMQQEHKEYKEYKQPEIAPPPPPSETISELPKVTETVSKSKPVNYLQEVSPRVQDPKAQSNANSLESVQGEQRVRRSSEAGAKPKQVNSSSPQLPQRQAVVKSVMPSLTSAPSASSSTKAPTQKVKTYEGEASTIPDDDLESTAEEAGMNNWWLALTIMLIVITSFGAGYFLMRPFINSK